MADAVYKVLVSGSVGNAARGSNEASLQALRLAVETRSRLGELFGYPHPNQVAFSMNATDSLNMAIQGLLEPGDHVITTQMEHNSVLRPLYRKEKEGIDLTIIPCDEKGRICLDVLAAACCEHHSAGNESYEECAKTDWEYTRLRNCEETRILLLCRSRCLLRERFDGRHGRLCSRVTAATMTATKVLNISSMPISLLKNPY